MISLVMVVHNEGHIVERAILSAKAVVDEILVVHDGECTDNTVQICKHLGAKVWIRPFQGIAEPHRPWLYEKASGEWILQLDADEYLSTEMATHIRDLCNQTEFAAYTFIWPTWDGERYITSTWPRKKILFQKNKIHFLGLPHCEVLPQGKTLDTDFILEHRPTYNNFTWSIFQSKWTKWAKIHANWIKRDPRTYTRYPQNVQSLLPRYYIIKRFPLLFSIPLGIYQGGLSYLGGGYRMGTTGLKISFMILLYWTLVGYYLF